MPALEDAPGKGLALVIDGNAISRGLNAQLLRDSGFVQVKTAARIIDAREQLERRRFDVVVCDHQLEPDRESGQDLMEELRREQQLPHATAFIMISPLAAYQQVAEAAEAALDGYLIKPFCAETLQARVEETRQRKQVLKDIFEAIESKDLERAVKLCTARFEQRRAYGLYAARIGLELLLRLKSHPQARALCQAVTAVKDVPWARLAAARVQLAEGDLSQARRGLDGLVSMAPHYADAYDILAKLQMEQGQLQQACDTYCRAAELTPGSILRSQQAGTLAFYAGESATSLQMLERCWLIGQRSRLFDVLSKLLLAYLRFDASDSQGLAQACAVMNRFAAAHPQSLRLRRMAGLGAILLGLLDGRQHESLALARGLLGDVGRPDFDIEAATNLLSLFVRLQPYGLEDPELSKLVARTAQRFSVSKVSTEMLCAALQRHPVAQAWIHDTHSEIMNLAETAVQHAVRGDPKLAVQSLLARGGETGNAKLIEMAGLVATRHQQRIEGVQPLLDTAATLARRFCTPISHIAGLRRSHRSAGGMVLRR